MANNMVLTGRSALDYLSTVNAARQSPYAGLSVFSNEVDVDGYDPATPDQAMDACDEDPSLVRLDLTALQADAV